MSENRRRRNNGAQNTQVKKARTNNARRILLLVGLMSLVAVISIGGTIAWLTDKTDAVTNTFTAADIDIDLVETWNADKNNDGTNDAWEAKLVPGTTYAKDPKVIVNENSEACWLFVHVDAQNNTISYTDANGVQATFPNAIEFGVRNDWLPVEFEVDGTPVAKAGYYYMTIDATTAKAGASYYVLTGEGTDQYANGKVTINDDLTKEMEESITTANQPKIVITAAAVQSENVDTLAEAWAKLPTDFTN